MSNGWTNVRSVRMVLIFSVIIGGGITAASMMTANSLHQARLNIAPGWGAIEATIVEIIVGLFIASFAVLPIGGDGLGRWR